MSPDGAHPERGSFVRDQVAALERLDGLDVELFEFAPGARALGRAAADLRKFPRFDVVHAHFGLTLWPALGVRASLRALTLHGTDLSHPRTRLATLAGLPFVDVLATVSQPLAEALPRWARARAQVLPCGADLARFAPIAREDARRELGLDSARPYLLFAADRARPEKRHDRAVELARAARVELLTLGGVDPDRVPLWVNAANAVVVPSEREGFGLAAVEALACDVPVFATPVGVHAELLAGIEGTLCAPYDAVRWGDALAPHLRALDPRIAGRERARAYSSDAMAERVARAWRAGRERGG
jgi:teichuronic acid biosynthesis glycosyltransferase TuaC